ncbi:hypothetical protein [Comamonas sp. 26]|uniref:hypothetical protein n=1 Tax=Comamonas sp. 26 TaxID=2035201 RepID=UPI000C66D41B|nr:hypothetical protein [Comamonas sp. 26]PIG07843.1 hypothetical protein CLU84_0670 [Comamonas sp. 26]
MNLPTRLTKITDIQIGDHSFLNESHQCFYWGEYTPYKGATYSSTNQLIMNLKKKMERRGKPDWHYKAEAIENVARQFSRLWNWGDVNSKFSLVVVPMPSSKAKADPEYDDRMMQVLCRIGTLVNVPLDIRDCLSFDGSCPPSHGATERPSVDRLYGSMSFNKYATVEQGPPNMIFLFDDVLTSGAHFVAASRALNENYPGAQIIGNFVARRALINPFENTDDS